jgi:hypothetical protein
LSLLAPGLRVPTYSPCFSPLEIENAPIELLLSIHYNFRLKIPSIVLLYTSIEFLQITSREVCLHEDIKLTSNIQNQLIQLSPSLLTELSTPNSILQFSIPDQVVDTQGISYLSRVVCQFTTLANQNQV